jgi:hypothetical protein
MTDEEIIAKREADILKMAGVDSRMRATFWRFYTNPTSPTFGNAAGSAREAGFTDAEANATSQYKWFKRGTFKEAVMDKAEDYLDKVFAIPDTTTKVIKGEEITSTDPAIIKIKQDTAKYITTTLGKKDYSPRTEISGKNGGPIETKSTPISDEEFENIINAYGQRRTKDSDIKENLSL